MALEPRTLDVMSSFTAEEQLYLYEKTKELKNAYISGDEATLRLFKIPNPNIGVYEVFLEDSTRTKESFRNAIDFLGLHAKIFDVSSSSFNKFESYADTFNMLTWYHNQIFIVRSKLEWVCAWLDKNGKEYATRQQLPNAPVFINAGDGRHEHPTQEFLDQFTFLETNNRNRDSIHIALIGDLLHGRTIHSKVEWLRIYKQVTVDLIAPDLITLPDYYIKQMKEYGYCINIFTSVDEYISSRKCANIRYFTRLQIERLGDDLLKLEHDLRYAITMRTDHLELLDMSRLHFFHPLPRHKVMPELPVFLDNYPCNGRERQSVNGMFMRIILLGVAARVPYVVNDYHSQWLTTEGDDDPFYTEVQVIHHQHKHFNEWVVPIDNGIVLDHVLRGSPIVDIKKRLALIVSVLWFYDFWGEWIGKTSWWLAKGMIFCPFKEIDQSQIKLLAAIAPWATLNIIRNKQVIKKMRLLLPAKISSIHNAYCKNPQCISHPQYYEHVPSSFTRAGEEYRCEYCGHHCSYECIR